MIYNKIGSIVALLMLFCGLFTACVKESVDSHKNSVSFTIVTKDATEVETKSNAHENDLTDVYLIVIVDGIFIECEPAINVSDNKYVCNLQPVTNYLDIIAVANMKDVIEEKRSSWVKGTTTYEEVSNDLVTKKPSSSVIPAMPEVTPLYCSQSLNKLATGMAIQYPFKMSRLTSKFTMFASGDAATSGFTLLGANIYNVSDRAFACDDNTKSLDVDRINYVGSEGRMIAQGTLEDPIYCYETPLSADNTKHPFLIINSNKGYYRVDLKNNVGEQLSLERNYWYKINISKVLSDGYPTIEEAINNPPLNAEILINDLTSHEIISNGIDYIGLSNSEYILYDSYALNEFNRDPGSGDNFDLINGYDIADLSYKSRNEGRVTCIECITESGVGKISFQNTDKGIWDKKTTVEEVFGWNKLTDELVLPITNVAVNKKIIINIPHDLKSGKLKIKIGELVKEIKIQRNEIISYMGDTLDMGSGFTSAKVAWNRSFEPKQYELKEYMPYGYLVPDLSDVTTSIKSTFFLTSSGASDNNALDFGSSENLYVGVKPLGFTPMLMYRYRAQLNSNVTEFYLTRHNDQSRTKVHLVQEPFRDGASDALPFGNSERNYCAAFWRNDEKGERIIRVPYQNAPAYWTARVIFGEDFIKLAYTDDTRTSGDAATTTGNPEDYAPDGSDKWRSFLQVPHAGGYPKFRIGLTGTNPNLGGKPRYGLVAFTLPYAETPGSGSSAGGQTFLILVRQGEEPDYVMDPTSVSYKGSERTLAHKFSPYNLTVADPSANPGGVNFSDHKSMGGLAEFAKYPTQQGYLYQWGRDIAIHPDNPNSAINSYSYDYASMAKDICPSGYKLAETDAANSAFFHSFVDEDVKRSQLGLCADGYYDRVKNGKSDPYIVESGSTRATTGVVYYNTKTRANIFIPKVSYRNFADGSIVSNKIIASWAHILAETGNKQGVLLGSPFADPSDPYQIDRGTAMPIRCIKIK